MELLTSDMITRALVLVSRKNHQQAQKKFWWKPGGFCTLSSRTSEARCLAVVLSTCRQQLAGTERRFSNLRQ